MMNLMGLEIGWNNGKEMVENVTHHHLEMKLIQESMKHPRKLFASSPPLDMAIIHSC